MHVQKDAFILSHTLYIYSTKEPIHVHPNQLMGMSNCDIIWVNGWNYKTGDNRLCSFQIMLHTNRQNHTAKAQSQTLPDSQSIMAQSRILNVSLL